MKNKLIVFLFSLMIGLTPVTSIADQFYGGLGLMPASGQPNFVSDGIMNINLAYETEKYGLAGWRFSYFMTNFKHQDDSSAKIKSNIFTAERMFVAKIQQGLTLIGTMGAGLFSTSAEVGGSTASSMDFGLSAAGSLRFALSSKVFLEGAYHFKNCAVSDDDGVVDGGFQGFFINVGMFF